MAVEVKLSGPLFDGRLQDATRLFLLEAVSRVALYGANLVVHECMRVFKEPTPYYWTRVTTERQHNSQDVRIGDDGVIYGPWLEGVGSRNRTTRFKGYWIYRRTVKLLDRRAKPIVDKTLADFMGRLRG